MSQMHMIRHFSALTQLAEDRRGVTAIVTALALTVVLGAAGLAVDVAYWLNSTRGLQAGADQMAYSAASAAGQIGCTSTTAIPQALAIGAARGYAKGATATTNGETTTATDGTTTVAVTCTLIVTWASVSFRIFPSTLSPDFSVTVSARRAWHERGPIQRRKPAAWGEPAQGAVSKRCKR